MTGAHDLVVVTHQLPIVGGRRADRLAWRPGPGGMVDAIHRHLRSRDGIWVGWPGVGVVGAHRICTVEDVRVKPVALSMEDLDNYYDGQCNATIRPLYHDAIPEPVFRGGWSQAYLEVNGRFAEAAAAVAAPGATVWVFDCELQLVPAALRALRPDLRIGFFLRSPFPPPELFVRLPLRVDIVRGLLGADVVGFQGHGGAENFRRLAGRLLGLHTDGVNVTTEDGRAVMVGTFPASVDVADVERRAGDPAVLARADAIRARLGHPDVLLVSIDALDHANGIEQRLAAFDELMGERRLPGAALVQIAVPSRRRVASHDQLRRRVEHLVGRINGSHARVGHPAVHYLHRPLSRDELVALYLAADAALVTPLRDGMSLVAKEYVAARLRDSGALVLSEFTGAAAELAGAHMVNPYDVDAVQRAIVAATTEPADRAADRIRSMRSHLRFHDSHAWARRLLTALDRQPSAAVH
jgi:trehalose 6-phosphate synthase